MSRVKVDIDPKTIDNFFGKLDNGLDDVADEGFAISQDLVSVDRGMLKKSGHVVREFLSKAIVYDSPEAPWMEYGTDAHMPPEEPIVAWVRRKRADLGIKAKDVKKVANAIRFSIAKKGTQPHPFLRPAFDDVSVRAKGIILKHFR
jgi:hypothetical protein